MFSTVKLVLMNSNAEISNFSLGSFAAQKCSSNKEQGPPSDLVNHLESEFQSNALSLTVLKLKMNGILWKDISNDRWYLFACKEAVMI